MINFRTLFDYFASENNIDYRATKVSLVTNDDKGPIVRLDEDNRYHPLSFDPEYVQNFSIFSMMALTQGSIYRDEVCLLPLARHQDYRALIIAWVQPGTAPIHERYFQLLFFLPKEVVGDLPNPVCLKHDLLHLVRSSGLLKSIKQSKLVEVKIELLQYLNSKTPTI